MNRWNLYEVLIVFAGIALLAGVSAVLNAAIPV